ncbi:MAG: hypothetical protein CM15mP85_11010 [Rhodobacterales bacterium]|nr:MAG: hypothetical protein CM15mP85_11010 [Rhodobacterales bacterium]
MADVVRATMDELVSQNRLDKVVELEAVKAVDNLARSVARRVQKNFRFNIF